MIQNNGAEAGTSVRNESIECNSVNGIERGEPTLDVTRAGVTVAPKYPYFRTMSGERSQRQSGYGRTVFQEPSRPTGNGRYHVQTNPRFTDVPEYHSSSGARLPRTEITRSYQVTD